MLFGKNLHITIIPSSSSKAFKCSHLKKTIQIYCSILICSYVLIFPSHSPKNFKFSKHLHNIYSGNMYASDMCFGVQTPITQPSHDWKNLFSLKLVINFLPCWNISYFTALCHFFWVEKENQKKTILFRFYKMHAHTQDIYKQLHK